MLIQSSEIPSVITLSSQQYVLQTAASALLYIFTLGHMMKLFFVYPNVLTYLFAYSHKKTDPIRAFLSKAIKVSGVL